MQIQQEDDDDEEEEEEENGNNEEKRKDNPIPMIRSKVVVTRASGLEASEPTR